MAWVKISKYILKCNLLGVLGIVCGRHPNSSLAINCSLARGGGGVHQSHMQASAVLSFAVMNRV